MGTAYEDDASCLLPSALPANVQVAREGPVPAVAERTWIPLGVICTIQPLGHHRTALVVPHQSWPATWTALIGFAIAASSTLAAAGITIRHRLGAS